MAIYGAGNAQQRAVSGGQKRRYPWESDIAARIPGLYATKARQENQAQFQQGLDLDTQGLDLESQAIEQNRLDNEAYLAEQRRSSDLSLAESTRQSGVTAGLTREQMNEQAAQAQKSQMISGAQTAGMGAYLGNKAGLFDAFKGGGSSPYGGPINYTPEAGKTAILDATAPSQYAQLGSAAQMAGLGTGGAYAVGPTAYTAAAGESALLGATAPSSWATGTAPAYAGAGTAAPAAAGGQTAGLGAGSTGTTTAATPVAAYAAPAAAGYVGGKAGSSIATHSFGEGWKQEKGGGIAGGAAAGAAVGSVVPGVGTAVGAVVGGVAGYLSSTWYCTEVDRTVGLSEDDHATLRDFFKYSMKNHRDVVKYYLRKGPEVVRFIHEAHEADTPQVFMNMNKTLVQPTIEHMKAGEPEKAYRHYADFGDRLFHDYTPHLVEEWTMIYRNDKPTDEKEAAHG